MSCSMDDVNKTIEPYSFQHHINLLHDAIYLPECLLVIIAKLGTSLEIQFCDNQGTLQCQKDALENPQKDFCPPFYIPFFQVLFTAHIIHDRGRKHGKKRYTTHYFDLLSDFTWHRRLKEIKIRWPSDHIDSSEIPREDLGTHLPCDAIAYRNWDTTFHKQAPTEKLIGNCSDYTMHTMHKEERASVKWVKQTKNLF
jgi:hypothetical protein